MKKIRVILVLIFISAFVLVGCYNIDYINYAKKYKKFLSYSLGTYEIVEMEKIRYSGGAPVPTYGSFYRWKIKYEDTKGQEQILMLNNRIDTFSSNATEDEYFASQIFQIAENLAVLQLKEEVLYKYFDETIFDKEHSTKIYIRSTFKNQDSFEGRCEYYLTFSDKKTGVKLKELTPQILVENFDYQFRFAFRTDAEDIDVINNYLEDFKSAMVETANYLGQDEIAITFDHKNEEYPSYEGVYNNITKQFEWE